MKKDIHPEYHKVVFYDTSSDTKFMTKSTMTSEETVEWEDGNSYPLIKVEVSSASHPFYTGKKLYVDTAGRVEKFNRRYKSKKAATPADATPADAASADAAPTDTAKADAKE